MKRRPKAVYAIALAAILLVTLSSLPAFAEEATQNTNYLTAKWAADIFSGTITETEEDGVTVTEYVPSATYSWFSPTLDVFQDLKTLIGSREGAVVNITFEIQSASDKDECESHAHVLFRAVNPRTGQLPFSAEEAGDWDGEGNAWSELYKENFDSDLEFYIENSNNYAFPEEANLDISKSGWTLYETGPIYISAADLNDTLFGGWLLCIDNMDYSPSYLKGVRLRNAAIYDCEEGTPTAAPTEVPTEAPTAAPTQEPVKTDAPTQDTATKAPADNTQSGTSEENNDKTDNGKKSNLGLILGIAGGAVVAAAVIVAIVAGKKKKNK